MKRHNTIWSLVNVQFHIIYVKRIHCNGVAYFSVINFMFFIHFGIFIPNHSRFIVAFFLFSFIFFSPALNHRHANKFNSHALNSVRTLLAITRISRKSTRLRLLPFHGAQKSCWGFILSLSLYLSVLSHKCITVVTRNKKKRKKNIFTRRSNRAAAVTASTTTFRSCREHSG